MGSALPKGGSPLVQPKDIEHRSLGVSQDCETGEIGDVARFYNHATAQFAGLGRRGVDVVDTEIHAPVGRNRPPVFTNLDDARGLYTVNFDQRVREIGVWIGPGFRLQHLSVEGGGRCRVGGG